MVRSLALVLSVGMFVTDQAGAKTMFYDPGDARAATVKASVADRGRLRPIVYAQPFPAYGHVGIHYWFEDGNGRIFSENKAPAVKGPFTLHIRNNVGGGFLTVWSMNGDGAEVTPREGQWAGYRMTAETFVVPTKLQFLHAEQNLRLIIVFARSQTEMAASVESARNRLLDLGSRVGRDRLPQIIRATDDTTSGEIGTYVVNREGMPVAAELSLWGR
jgi:hypothetical protein